MVYTDGVHLIADSWDELHKFAQSIGLKREWFQQHPRHPHYDIITASKMRRAIKAGAIKMRSIEMFKMMVKKGMWKSKRRIS